jgi:hypothetical protein
MNIIKFSKYYKKLPPDANGKIAWLLFAIEIELGKQVKHFLNYDTEAIDGTSYPLPQEGRYIFLLFLLEGTIYTTLRRSTPEKLSYYLKEVKKPFMVEVAV